MSILDDLKKIKKIDSGNVLETIQQIPDQMEQAWSETKKIKFPDSYARVKNVFVMGMGGSGWTPEIVKSLLRDKLNVSYEIYRGYNLSKYVDRDTLIVLSTYSGTTYEVLDAGKEALKKKLKITGITRGAQLARFLKKNNIPGYIFKELYNPSKQPRLGGGYMVLGHMGILKKCRLLDISDKKIRTAINFAREKQKLWDVKISQEKNIAKKLAYLLKDKILIIVAAEFLEGNAHGLRNQVNECAKSFADYHVIPELNHHLMEGLKFPKTNKKNLIFLFINSSLYLPINQKRFSITKDVVFKNGIRCIDFKPSGKTKFEQSFEFFSFGSYLSFYLSILNKVNPQKIPWVDYFKKKLAES